VLTILRAPRRAAGAAEEISRRTFNGKRYAHHRGVVGLVLAVPIVGSLLPRQCARQLGAAQREELDALQTGDNKPVKLTFTPEIYGRILPERQRKSTRGNQDRSRKVSGRAPDIFDVRVRTAT